MIQIYQQYFQFRWISLFLNRFASLHFRFVFCLIFNSCILLVVENITSLRTSVFNDSRKLLFSRKVSHCKCHQMLPWKFANQFLFVVILFSIYFCYFNFKTFSNFNSFFFLFRQQIVMIFKHNFYCALGVTLIFH